MGENGIKERLSGWKKRLGGYKYAVLVIAVGLLLLLWPQKKEEVTEPASVAQSADSSVEALEEKLEEKLSQITGVGKTSVILSVETGTEYVFATDKAMEEDSREETLVILSGDEGAETPVTVEERSPVFRGALVICEGGNDPAVKLQVTQAVAVLTGLGADRISVCQGN